MGVVGVCLLIRVTFHAWQQWGERARDFPFRDFPNSFPAHSFLLEITNLKQLWTMHEFAYNM